MPNTDGPSEAELLNFAVGRSGRAADDIREEFERLSKGRGKLRFREYVDFGLYDSARFRPDDKERFLSDRFHWAIVKACCDPTWVAATEDKWLMETLMKRAGVPTPTNLAVLDPGIRHYPGTPKISNLADFRRFLADRGGRRFFGKRIRGMASAGIFACVAYDEKVIQLAGKQAPIPIETFYETEIGKNVYLLQRLLRNHPFLARFGRHLSSVRLGLFVYDDRVSLAYSFLKMPSGSNVADRVKLAGNVACEINPADGKIISILRKDAIGTTRYETHPETGEALVGETVPHWDEVKKIAEVVARTVAPIRYQSMDIAITERGPVLLEVNTGGGFAGVQLATGRGLLQPHFTRFLAACGIDLDRT